MRWWRRRQGKGTEARRERDATSVLILLWASRQPGRDRPRLTGMRQNKTLKCVKVSCVSARPLNAHASAFFSAFHRWTTTPRTISGT